MIYERPKYKNQYENFIGGEWIAPSSGEYVENISAVDGKLLTKIPKNNPAFKAIIFISCLFFIPRPIETANASILKANANIKTSNI